MPPNLSEQEEFELLSLERERAMSAPKPETSATPKSKSFGEMATNALSTYAKYGLAPLETAMSIGSGTAASALGGLAGLGQGAMNVVSQGTPAAERVRQVQGALTYQPQGEPGRKLTGIVSYPFEKLAQGADWAGGKVSEATGSPALGAGINTAIQAAPFAVSALAPKAPLKPRTPEPLAGNIRTARESGYALTPDEANAGIVSRTLGGLSGESKLARHISNKNQAIHDQKIAQDLGLPKETILDREVLNDVRKDAGLQYEVVKNTGTVKTDAQYQTDLANISKSYDMAARDFPHRSEKPFQKTMDGLDRRQFSAESAVEEIKLLRDDAYSEGVKGNKALAGAYRKASLAIENMLDRHMQSSGASPEIIKNFREARVRIAKAYAAEDALNPVTGHIDANVYARALQAGKPLTGQSLEVGRFASAFPRSAQKTAGKPTDAATFWDIALGGLSHEWPLAFSRPIARGVIASEPYQMMMANDITRPTLNSLAQFQREPGVALGEVGAEQRNRR